MPPARSGIAAVNADLLPLLQSRFDIDVFVDDVVFSRRQKERREAEDRDAHRTVEHGGLRVRSAHDFIWLNQRAPYDLTVYQLGNSSVHDYMWPYLFRYPGLTVLHDARLHHARAAALLRGARPADYRAEFAANQPGTSPDLAELAVDGFDNHLHYFWPMTRLVVARSRLTAVHAPHEIGRLREEAPGGRIEPIRLGHGSAIASDAAERGRIRARYRIPPSAVLFGCFGGLSPEKRLPQILAAFAATRAYHPDVHLVLAGATPEHYDLQSDIGRLGIGASTIVTGYLESDDDLNAHISCCDVALNLRWPTAREMSGPWLRCLSAGLPTVITELSHLAHVPSLDPRTWRPWTRVSDASDEAGHRRVEAGNWELDTGDSRDADPALRRPPSAVSGEGGNSQVEAGNWKLETGSWKLEAGSWKLGPVCVAIDILDEDHSLRLAMRRLVRDAELRHALGRAGRLWWEAHHTPELMLEDYHRLIPLAIEQPVRDEPLPAHLLDDGSRTLERVLAAFGLGNPLR
jgi:glycosyltransferase involved in cell wall biosynthesis